MQPMPGMRTRSRSRYYKVALRWRGKGDTRRLETFDRSTKDRAREWIFFLILSLFFFSFLFERLFEGIKRSEKFIR